LALTTGSRLGVYEVTAPIGEGGMGAVYRATDTSLGRQVAIKVLPDAFAQDADRLARFEREAKTLAALNHPHIAAIYGFERSSGTQALVMELVEGEDLSERIARGALPVDEALPIAKQIADALEAAHEQGIIHRDLKPANIKLRSDGTVKVLDFGLAKLASPAEAGHYAPSNLSLSPTITSPAMMTGAGIILGTAAYMAPEQARGRAVDKRADIWAFGAVLFEMLTGTRAFEGEDIADTLGNVMKVEPNWQRVPASVPPRVERVLRSCLQKKATQRLDSAQAVRLILDGDFDTVAPHIPNEASQPAPPAARPLWRRALPFAVTALVVAAVALGAGWQLKPADPGPVIRAVHVLPGTRTFRSTANGLAVSPDGRDFLYNGTGGLYLRSIDAVADRLIPGTERLLQDPVFSPDGQSVAFWQDGQIRRIARSGGASVALTPSANPAGLSWEADGTLLYALADGVWQVSEDGGEPRRLLTSSAGEIYSYPQRLPGGDWILLTLRPGGAPTADRAAVAQSLATGERRTLRSSAAGATYVASGHLVYVYGGVLYAVPFDVKSVRVTGGPVPVVEGVRTVVGDGVPHLSVSRTGTLAYLPGPVGTPGAASSILEADRAGVVTPSKAAPAPYGHIRASRDGTRLAVDTDDGKEAFVSIHDVAGTSAPRRLTFAGRNRLPIWSPDGQRIAYQSDREGDLAIFVQRADGTGVAERLTKAEKGEAHVPESWSPDGRHISFSIVKASSWSLWILTVDNGMTSPFGDVQSTEAIGSVFSPDGRWIAYHALPAGVDAFAPSAGVFVQPFPATGARYQAPRISRDFMPLWSPDVRELELFYVPATASGRLAAVRVVTTSGLTFGRPDSLPFALTGGRLSAATRPFDVLPNGRFVGPGAANADESGAASSEVRLVFNWFEELKRLVPVQ
jgi:Tol biopolymer transport system component